MRSPIAKPAVAAGRFEPITIRPVPAPEQVHAALTHERLREALLSWWWGWWLMS